MSVMTSTTKPFKVGRSYELIELWPTGETSKTVRVTWMEEGVYKWHFGYVPVRKSVADCGPGSSFISKPGSETT